MYYIFFITSKTSKLWITNDFHPVFLFAVENGGEAAHGSLRALIPPPKILAKATDGTEIMPLQVSGLDWATFFFFFFFFFFCNKPPVFTELVVFKKRDLKEIRYRSI
jgi:hypothetical protein